MRKVDDLDALKAQADLIIANRLSDELEDVRPMFTRDVFNAD